MHGHNPVRKQTDDDGSRLWVQEVFRTIQGEGTNAGRAAVFVRFAGCNLWSGLGDNRDRDAKRNDVDCPRWCDTDFLKDRMVEEGVLIDIIAEHDDTGLIVFTGGEPLLHLNPRFLARLHSRCHSQVAIETNGTVELDASFGNLIQHICVSPKVPPERMKLRTGDELKVVVPAYDPDVYAAALDRGELYFPELFVQPLDDRVLHPIALSGRLAPPNPLDVAKQYVLDHPSWRLSYQLHKAIGVR